jgi:hypothetical protein
MRLSRISLIFAELRKTPQEGLRIKRSQVRVLPGAPFKTKHLAVKPIVAKSFGVSPAVILWSAVYAGRRAPCRLDAQIRQGAGLVRFHVVSDPATAHQAEREYASESIGPNRRSRQARCAQLARPGKRQADFTRHESCRSRRPSCRSKWRCLPASFLRNRIPSFSYTFPERLICPVRTDPRDTP